MNKEVKKIFDNNLNIAKLYYNEKQEYFTTLNSCEESKKGKCKVIERDSIQEKVNSVEKFEEILENKEDTKSFLNDLNVTELKKISEKYPNLKLGKNLRKEEMIDYIIKEIDKENG